MSITEYPTKCERCDEPVFATCVFYEDKHDFCRHHARAFEIEAKGLQLARDLARIDRQYP